MNAPISASRMFLISAQSLNTDFRLGIPRSDEDIIEILVRNGVIDDEMRPKLKGMKGFRNIIIYRYAGNDDRLSH
jgi:uncharacterized protein YutE (UPF0331/DUF86 family)